MQDFRTFVTPILIEVETGIMDRLCNKTVVLEEDFNSYIESYQGQGITEG